MLTRTRGATSAEGFGRGAAVLSVGIASTGVLTFAYFSVASHVLDASALGRINLLWTLLFITMSVIYRPVEQLLSRSIAAQRSNDPQHRHSLRGAAFIQLGFAVTFLTATFALKGPLLRAFDNRESLYVVLIVAAAAYAGSYFARGFFAGHQWFALYGGLVLFESVTRFCFPVGVALIGSGGENTVALGIAVAPLASMLLVPVALRRTARPQSEPTLQRSSTAARQGASFAFAVAAVQVGEQTLLNAGPFFSHSSAQFAAVFGVFLIVRAPLQLFQAVQTSLLPHLAVLHSRGKVEAAARAVRMTSAVIALFASAVTLTLLVVGPKAMELLYPTGAAYGRWGLALMGVGMGIHLISGTLNQGALAAGAAHRAAASWAASAVGFLAWMAIGPFGDPLLNAQGGYVFATTVLCTCLLRVGRSRTPAHVTVGALDDNQAAA